MGARAVEAYVPIQATGSASSKVIGVLEIYLPYAPIAHSFAASNRAMTALIMLGLILLWIALSAISWSVTRRLRRSNAENEHMALHDLLTDLPNRALFVDRAGHAIAAARRSSQPVGIAIVDLDRFKEVNDTLGHHNGDDYLCRIATHLAEILRPGDTIARLGGDEFGLVLPGVDAEHARPILDRVLHTLAADIDVAGVPVSSEASIGIAFWPIDGTEVTDLLQRADLAVHAAKETHQAILEYSADLAHFSPARLALVSQLRHAIAADELVLHYQPKLDLKTNRIVSVEALLRWQHPTRGLLVPADFLEIAESTGLIDPLTDWVLDHALAQLALWHAQGLIIDVAVNISARNLRNESLAGNVFRCLSEHGVEPEHLEIEITETALIADPRRAQVQLQRLRDHGVRVSLDDFGQGYTSLAQLGSLPLAELKIDRSFVAGMLTNANDRTIVSTVIDLGHKFGLEVVAEGAESADILERAGGARVATRRRDSRSRPRCPPTSCRPGSATTTATRSRPRRRRAPSRGHTRAEPTAAVRPAVVFETSIEAVRSSISTRASIASPATTMPTKRRSTSPCSRKSSPHSSSRMSYAGPATCTPCATRPGMPSVAAVSASEWKLPRREYARTSSSVTVERRAVLGHARVQRRGRCERDPRVPQRLRRYVGGRHARLDVDVVTTALLVAVADHTGGDQLAVGRRARGGTPAAGGSGSSRREP